MESSRPPRFCGKDHPVNRPGNEPPPPTWGKRQITQKSEKTYVVPEFIDTATLGAARQDREKFVIYKWSSFICHSIGQWEMANDK